MSLAEQAVENAQKEMHAAMFAAGLNQEKLAALIGVAQSTVSKWFNRENPGLLVGLLMAEALGLGWEGGDGLLRLVKKHT
jgi:transcriptional regulator with XRE-family HTH domain